MSQEALGFESGYHRTYISMLERGLQNPSLRTILSLATALNVPAAEIVQRVEDRLGKDWVRSAGSRIYVPYRKPFLPPMLYRLLYAPKTPTRYSRKTRYRQHRTNRRDPAEVDSRTHPR